MPPVSIIEMILRAFAPFRHWRMTNGIAEARLARKQAEAKLRQTRVDLLQQQQDEQCDDSD